MFSNSNKSVSFEFCTQRILKKHEYNSPYQVHGIQPKTPCHREPTMSFNPQRISKLVVIPFPQDSYSPPRSLL